MILAHDQRDLMGNFLFGLRKLMSHIDGLLLPIRAELCRLLSEGASLDDLANDLGPAAANF